MWASKELKNTDFNDIRLRNRMEKILDDLTEQPTASIPQASGSPAATKATYRFLNNENVAAQEIRKGFRLATIERMIESKEEVFLFPSDATNIVYSSHKKLEGIGVLKNQKARGLNLHTTLVVTEQNLVLGSIQQHCWGRKPEDYGQRALRANKPIEEKESYRWIESFNASQSALPDHKKGIFLGDRGADIYDLFLIQRKPNMHLLIRALHDRTLADESEKMFAHVEKSPCVGIMEVKISRSGGRIERTAQVEIRYANVTVKSPQNKSLLPPINITIVCATEIIKNADDKDPIRWRLLTTLPIDSLEKAIYAVSTYSKRWIIERYHYTLKQGCQVEELQLEHAERIEKAVALYSIVACRIMYMTYLSRISPDLPCTAVFSDDEWRALYCYANKTAREPKSPPNLRKAMLMLAQIGGFINRKNSEPGVKVIWTGMSKLEGASEMYRILKGKDVGNV